MSLVFLEDLVNNADVINNVGQFLEDTTAGMSQQMRDVVGGIVASEPAKKIRDKLLDWSNAPLPERFFVQGLTGGIQGDKVTTLPRETLQTMKAAWEYSNMLGDDGMSEGERHIKGYLKFMDDTKDEAFARLEGTKDSRAIQSAFNWEYAWLKGRLDSMMKARSVEGGGQVDPYHFGTRYGEWNGEGQRTKAFRDFANSIGGFGVYFDKQGNVLLKDTWKVDNPEQKAVLQVSGGPAEPGDLSGREGKQTGGYWNAADRLGTYREIPIEIRLTKEEWEALGTGDAINPFNPSQRRKTPRSN